VTLLGKALSGGFFGRFFEQRGAWHPETWPTRLDLRRQSSPVRRKETRARPEAICYYDGTREMNTWIVGKDTRTSTSWHFCNNTQILA
jgi:hypothetical protein